LCNFIRNKIIFAQAVTDNSKETEVNAALNAEEQTTGTTQPVAAANAETAQPQQQPAAQPATTQPALPPFRTTQAGQHLLLLIV